MAQQFFEKKLYYFIFLFIILISGLIFVFALRPVKADNFNCSANEICGDGLDNNCDGRIDEGCPYIPSNNPPPACIDADNDGHCVNQNDCDDHNPAVYLGASEICDGIDNNCDGRIDEGCPFTPLGGRRIYIDNDGDGFYAGESDCDDNNSAIYVGAPEICDGRDNNCDGRIDEGCPYIPSNNPLPVCVDADKDGYCFYNDCDDNNYNIHPGAVEICDNKDNNCDGRIDEYCVDCTDNDKDGFCLENGDCDDNNFSVNPQASEVCNGIDDNCDARVDEGCSPGGGGGGGSRSYMILEEQTNTGTGSTSTNQGSTSSSSGSNIILSAEQEAIGIFGRIYGHLPQSPIDWLFVNYVAYGYNPSPRDLEKEEYGITRFNGVFGHLPASNLDWNIVKAIAYSGVEQIPPLKEITKPKENLNQETKQPEKSSQTTVKNPPSGAIAENLETENKEETKTEETPIEEITTIVTEGDLVKSPDNLTVYLIQNGLRLPFLHQIIFDNWGYSLDNIKTVPNDYLNQYPIGRPIMLKEGTLFRGTNRGLGEMNAATIYLVSNQTYRPFASNEVYQSIFNDPSWSKVIWLPDEILDLISPPDGYALGDPINSQDEYQSILLGEIGELTKNAGNKGELIKYLAGLGIVVIVVLMGIYIKSRRKVAA